ncbi:Bromo adjacent homology domain-containing 1 protein [Trachymyrmex septentrionalis]|uniref:Bromo adjacent homology domain-containing 1 protein n=1 Tax=Trachymyrmex septentrionalis TaxID=34720 RepID=A0A195FQN4_9HYME|nr:Bromo adjacent homology domain-containing 1 protein [Trachymyrmex septentrionalis]
MWGGKVPRHKEEVLPRATRANVFLSLILRKGIMPRSIKVAPIRDKFDKCALDDDDDDEGIGSMTKIRCRICELLGEDQGLNHGLSHPCHLTNLNHLRPGLNYSPLPNMNYLNHGLLNGLYLPQLKDMMLAAYLLRAGYRRIDTPAVSAEAAAAAAAAAPLPRMCSFIRYYQPAGPLIQHPPPPPPTLPPIKGPPPEPTPTPPQNSEGSDDLVATSTTSGGTSSTGGGFYRTYCPQYYGTPQYPDLCYPPTYPHPHPHPPHFYKYPPTYRRQYYGYQESGGGGGPPPGSGAAGGGPGVVDYQPPPPPPGEYPLPYYGGYPPPPHPPPPPPNPAYLHSQGRPFVDPSLSGYSDRNDTAFTDPVCAAAFQGCPCPMQSCPKNVDTGALIGNGKGAPVVSGPGLSLPPSAMVGPPSPARGLAGLAPPPGANAWDTDRVQINTHRNLNQNQPPSVPPSHNLVGGHSRLQNQDCRSKDEQNCTEDTLRKCGCQNACTSTCEVKMETLSPTEKLSVTASCPSSKYHNFKLENNNVKCESCSMEIDGLPCVANCNVVKCESDYKCDIMKCEQCMKEGQIAILEMDKDSGIVLDDKLDGDPDVKEELDVVVIDSDENWKKPDYEPTVQETVDDKEEEEEEEDEGEMEEEVMQGSIVTKVEAETEEQPKCQKVTKRKLSLDSLSDSRKKRKLSKRALSVGSSQDANNEELTNVIAIEPLPNKADSVRTETTTSKKKQTKKDVGPRGQKRKAETPSANESATKKVKSGKQSIVNCLKRTASDISIMETINDVIQQSLQMTQRKDRKSKNCERVEKKKKNVKEESLPTTKKPAKKIDQVKEHTIEKVSKAVSKNGQAKSKTDAKPPKLKASQDAKVKVCKSKIGKIMETKAQDIKSRSQDSKARDSSKKRDILSKTKASDVSEDPKKSAVIKKKRKTAVKKVANAKKSGCKVENSSLGNESLTLTRKTFLKPKWNNGWSWEGEPFEAKVYLTNEETAIRRCYASMNHESGDVLRPRDCVLLRSGTRKGDLPYVAKIAALWENPDDGEMMFSLLWYYRPEHTEQGRTPHDSEDEVFASRHRDANSVACIEDKCYILTFNEYCRYRKNLRRIEEGLENPGLIVPPGDQVYPRENRQPPIPVPSDMVLFCRRVYDYRGKKLVKNPG